MVEKFTSIKESIVHKTISLTQIVFPLSPLQTEYQLPRAICSVTSSHSSDDTDTFSTSALGLGSAPANAEIIQLVDVESTSIVEMSAHMIKTLSKELLFSAPLDEDSNKNLK